MIVRLHLENPEPTTSVYANVGGPMTRTRTERITVSLLGQDDGYIRCPRFITVGLSFASTRSPVEVMEELLAAEGLSDPEDLREEFVLPSRRLLARPAGATFERLVVSSAERRNVLEQALFLGLCTAQIFDPERPVLWTEASLTRALELFDASGFYA